MITAEFSDLLVLGCVTEEITDAATKQKNPWHRLDLRDEQTGGQLYISLTDPAAKRLSEDESKSAKTLLENARKLPMGERVSVVAEVTPSVTPSGAQKIALRLRSFQPLTAKLPQAA